MGDEGEQTIGARLAFSAVRLFSCRGCSALPEKKQTKSQLVTQAYSKAGLAASCAFIASSRIICSMPSAALLKISSSSTSFFSSAGALLASFSIFLAKGRPSTNCEARSRESRCHQRSRCRPWRSCPEFCRTSHRGVGDDETDFASEEYFLRQRLGQSPLIPNCRVVSRLNERDTNL